MKKPNCYNCKFRGTVPGSAHSSCTVLRNPASGEDRNSELIELGLATGNLQLTDKYTNEPIVKLDKHGVRNGWANWPIDFDPVWVERCAFETTNDLKS